MTTPEERISTLEAIIEKYEAKLDAAITFEEKKMYADLVTATLNEITETQKTLNALLQQQQQGKLIIPSRLSLQHRCFEINPISLLTPHLTISFASFCNIAQTGGGQGELLCCVVVRCNFQSRLL